MDFRRIEVIFIVVFAILNAYLLGSYWQTRLESGITSPSGSSQSATILKEMRNDQIMYMPLSNKKTDGYYATAKSDNNDVLKNGIKHLTGQNARVENNRIVSVLTQDLTVDPQQPEKELNTIVEHENYIFAGADYDYNANLSTGTNVVYTQKIDGRSVYGHAGQLIFHMDENGKVSGYDQGHLTEAQQLRAESELISQTRAVTWLYQYNEIQNDSKIVWADLGYTHLLTTDNGVVYVPTWVIGIKSKSSTGTQIKRINAFSGVLIKKDSETAARAATVATDASSTSSSTVETSSSTAVTQ
jgi:regulatory protein YycI of two-component signal transduction system YycFG